MLNFTPKSDKKDKYPQKTFAQVKKNSYLCTKIKILVMKKLYILLAATLTAITAQAAFICNEYRSSYYDYNGGLWIVELSTPSDTFSYGIRDSELRLGKTYTFSQMEPVNTYVDEWYFATDATFCLTKDAQGLKHVKATMTTSTFGVMDIVYDETRADTVEVRVSKLATYDTSYWTTFGIWTLYTLGDGYYEVSIANKFGVERNTGSFQKAELDTYATYIKKKGVDAFIYDDIEAEDYHAYVTIDGDQVIGQLWLTESGTGTVYHATISNKDLPTGLTTAPTQNLPTAEKQLRDGQLFILREGKVYDMQGIEKR